MDERAILKSDRECYSAVNHEDNITCEERPQETFLISKGVVHNSDSPSLATKLPEISQTFKVIYVEEGQATESPQEMNVNLDN